MLALVSINVRENRIVEQRKIYLSHAPTNNSEQTCMSRSKRFIQMHSRSHQHPPGIFMAAISTDAGCYVNPVCNQSTSSPTTAIQSEHVILTCSSKEVRVLIYKGFRITRINPDSAYTNPEMYMRICSFYPF
jgi:hypothetical protein